MPMTTSHYGSPNADSVVAEPAVDAQRIHRGTAIEARSSVGANLTSQSLSPATLAHASNTVNDVVLLAPAPIYLGEFAGTPIFAPPGTPLIVECDRNGRWTCRVGPLLRLSPVGSPEVHQELAGA